MSLVSTKGRYHVALNGLGLILQGAPDRLAYSQNQAPIYGNRFAQGDRSYADFTFWWFWTQTNWAAGYKQDRRWQDDGTFFDSAGINPIQKPSSIILSNNMTVSNTVVGGKNMIFNDYGTVGGLSFLVGRNVTDQKMRAVLTSNGATFFEDSNTGATESILCSASMDDSVGYLGCATVGSGSSMLKKITSSGTVTDVGTVSTGGGIYAIVPYKDAQQLFLFTFTDGLYVYDLVANTLTQKKTAYPFPTTSSSNYSFSRLAGHGCAIIGVRIYFLIIEKGSSKTQLWAYDIGTDAFIHIWTFGAGAHPSMLIEFNQNLYLFDTNAITGRLTIWKYSPSISTVTTVGSMVKLKEIGRYGDVTSVRANPVKDSTGIYFLVYNGTANQIWQINENDYVFSGITPPAAYATAFSDVLLAMDGNGFLSISKGGSSATLDTYTASPATTFQTTGYVTTGIFDGNIPGLDKLWYSAVLNFDALVSGQTVVVDYSTDMNKTFSNLGTASFSVDGGITNKDFYFPSGLISKTLMLRVTITGGGTNTPSLNDHSVKYIPFVNYTKQWSINVNAGDNVKGLDGLAIGKPGRELKGILEASWWAKSVLDFQDVDYASCKLTADVAIGDTTITVDNALDFPEQGRLRIDGEEIIYLGKTATTFTNCIRASRETRQTTHSSTTQVHNGYRVIITDLDCRVPIVLEDKRLEYTVQLSLREA